ncbi:peptidase S8/S53 domain-containing protein [Zychaea mexicana]|uniref:peptidase S8/S53 domain-containing protein n=1 Tax=Zychaea mexicana TaxID=64656 RepID=UPI0022FE588C|nr:peptidase S8/S53 domain-containing protein [Zychaea mexicana]KAI9495422.1 peptidase S8/S53 domain-containing protein [Zychaea mexicana]
MLTVYQTSCLIIGHGTHVSGIIAGVDPSKSFLGVAPDVTLGMWRVFGCSGGASEDTIIKAMEMAYAAGCNVINLSLGTQSAWAENAMAVVADRLAKNGVVVVSVAGNQGSDGVFMQNSPGSGSRVISVASVDNSFYLTRVATANTFPDEVYPYELSTSTERMPNGTLAVLFDKLTQDIITACSADAIPFTFPLTHSILLVRRGECNYAVKLQVAEQAGAKAVLFYDSKGQDTDRAVQALTAENTIPSAGIPKSFADKLIKEASKTVNSTALSVSFSINEYNQTIPSAGQISSFSSVGPTYELDLKPTLAGIGNQVLSTMPLRMSSTNVGWATRSGTSMAAPHISGVVALLLEYHKQQKRNITADAPAFVTELLQNHAQIAMFDTLPDHPLLQGAGLVQPFTSLQSGIHVSPGHISFNDTTNIVKTHQIHIANDGIKPVTAQLQHSPSKAILPYTNTSSFTLAQPHQRDDTHVELEFVPSRITLDPGQSVDIQVTIHLPPIDYHYQMYGGFIQFVQEDDHTMKSKLASMPYFGVLGSVNELPLFDQNFPYLAPGGNPDIMYGPSETFILNTTHAQYPDIICRLLSPTARVSIQVVTDDDTIKVIGDIDGGPFKYWERNRLAGTDYYRSIQWNGKIVTNGIGSEATTMVSQGTYRLRLRALKMFGNPDIPEQWEEWISGPILVQ